MPAETGKTTTFAAVTAAAPLEACTQRRTAIAAAPCAILCWIRLYADSNVGEAYRLTEGPGFRLHSVITFLWMLYRRPETNRGMQTNPQGYVTPD